MTPDPGRTATESARSSAHRETLEAVWFDRDLGWIEFNHRVLAEALDERTPLLERVKFLAIFSSNLDEFFMKRIAVLREHPAPERQRLLAQIRSRLDPLLRQQATTSSGASSPISPSTGSTCARGSS
jgi:polyphosphate kinase